MWQLLSQVSSQIEHPVLSGWGGGGEGRRRSGRAEITGNKTLWERTPRRCACGLIVNAEE